MEREREATDSSAVAAHAQQVSPEQTSEHEESEEEEVDEVRSELQRKTTELQSVTQHNEAATEIELLKRELQQEMERYKQLWRMNCANLVEHDATLAAKDDEISSLQQQLSRSRGVLHATLTSTDRDAMGIVDPVPRPGTHLNPESTTGSPASSSHEPPGLEDTHHRVDRRPMTTVPRRQGKAPPIDSFTGEDPEMRFEDWLPSLDRAAEWNQWTPPNATYGAELYKSGDCLKETTREIGSEPPLHSAPDWTQGARY